MSQELSHPGHVGLVRRQVELNRQSIVDAIAPPKGFTSQEVVTWIENLLSQHHTLCQQEFDRHPPYQRYTGD